MPYAIERISEPPSLLAGCQRSSLRFRSEPECYVQTSMIREILRRLRKPLQKTTDTLEQSRVESLNSGDVEESVEETTVCSPPVSVGHESKGPVRTHAGEEPSQPRDKRRNGKRTARST